MFSMHLQTLSLRASAAQAPGQHLLRAAELADSSAGFTAPHPNAGCVLAHGKRVVGEGFLYAQGTTSAEVQAVERARDNAFGAVAYLNLEPGDCHGDDSAVTALKEARVSRVVVGLPHPILHLRGKAINALRNEGIPVDILGEGLKAGDQFEEALQSCKMVNAPLLCRAAQHMPFSVLKYAMTLDGKIASSTGHASWVSSKESRKLVFATRGRSDAIIVGGNTVRRDNPRLTTRQEGGHVPVRIVMSRTLHLPEELHLWDVSYAPTIVMTQRGVRSDFQARLAARGVEIVEFDFLTPKGVMDYCYVRGFFSVLWECGGMLSAPAIASGCIHKVLAFVAPKIIGGVLAPSPVGELGMVEMTQALDLSDVAFEKTGPDMLITGYLQRVPGLRHSTTAAAVTTASVADNSIPSTQSRPAVISFSKTWEPYGALSNFSPHPISVPDFDGKTMIWRSVEHYYQAQKFAGVEDSAAKDIVEKIQGAPSPEEAARCGLSFMRERPDLIRRDWDSAKVDSMYRGLRVKFSSYPILKMMLLSTAGSVLMESSTHDLFGGAGITATGQNNLGLLLMRLRSEFLSESQGNLRSAANSAADFLTKFRRQ